MLLRVSIHALLAESDPGASTALTLTRRFNPRPPCGERLTESIHTTRLSSFQSTPSLRRATEALRQILVAPNGFNPRPPCGERLRCNAAATSSQGFNPRPPCGERLRSGLRLSIPAGFNPRPPCGERLLPMSLWGFMTGFNPRPPCGERRVHRWERSERTLVSIHALLAESDCLNGTCC